MVTYFRNKETGRSVPFPDESETPDGYEPVDMSEGDDRTVLHALPEDQPDSLAEGTTSNQADLDATPAEKTSEPAEPAERPNKSETKDVWVDYAVSQGWDREAAEDATKDELYNEFG